jgi:hypothetical protein
VNERIALAQSHLLNFPFLLPYNSSSSAIPQP